MLYLAIVFFSLPKYMLDQMRRQAPFTGRRGDGPAPSASGLHRTKRWHAAHLSSAAEIRRQVSSPSTAVGTKHALPGELEQKVILDKTNNN